MRKITRKPKPEQPHGPSDGSALFHWHLYGGYALSDPTDPTSDAVGVSTVAGPSTVPPGGRTSVTGALVEEFVVQLPGGGEAGYVCTFDHDPSEQEERDALAAHCDRELRLIRIGHALGDVINDMEEVPDDV